MPLRALIIGTVISAKVLPNTMFLNKYRKYRATYNFDGTELEVPKKVIKRFQDVLNDLKVPEDIRNKIKIFSVHDVHIFHAGVTSSTYGAIIGIPPNYNFESVDHLNRDDVTVEGKSHEWSEEVSNKFLESLVLSENAQKFAIAHEVIKVQRTDIFKSVFSDAIDCFLLIIVHDILYKIFKFDTKTRSKRCGLWIMCGTTAITLWFIIEQFIKASIEEEITTELAKLGPKYVQGGKEFYEKLCQLYDIGNHTSNSKVTVPKLFKRSQVLASQQKEFFALKLRELENNIM